MARHPRTGDWGLIPGSGRSRRRRKWQPTPSILAWEMPRREEPEGPQSMGCIKVGLKPATTNTSISKDHTQVCVCVRVCVCVYLLLPSWSLSRNLHVFLPLYLLTASRRPVRLAPASPRRSGSGSGACAGQLSPLAWVRASVCVSVCVPACGSSALSGRSRAWRGVKGGASVVRRGGAEALRSTAPSWLLLGLGTGQVPGKLGAQVSLRLGPQEVQRPLGRGGWEAAGAEDRHIRGRAGLSSEWDPGEAPLSQRGRVWSCRGWEGAETSAPLSPAPRPRAHARTHALPVNGGSWKTLGPPGPARRLLVWYWRCSGGGPASAGRSPVAGLAAQVQHAPRREVRPVGPTCRAERKGGEAQGS